MGKKKKKGGVSSKRKKHRKNRVFPMTNWEIESFGQSSSVSHSVMSDSLRPYGL